MSKRLLAKLLMTLGIAQYTFGPPIVDLLTNTHVFHSGWLPHARMHTVWLIGLTTGLGLWALASLWLPSGDAAAARDRAAALSALILGAFFLAAATMPLYDGALTDVRGVAAGPGGVDQNVFGFGVSALLIAVGWWLARGSEASV